MSDVLAQSSSETLSDEQKDKLFAYIKERTGMVFASRLHGWVMKQFDSIFTASKAHSMSAFYTSMTNGAKEREAQAFFECLTVHETMFYRDKRYFAFLVDKVLPHLIDKNKDKKSISIWIAAGSSGQEIYSILFTILDKFPELKTWNLNLYSTDLSQQIVDKAKEGIYENHEVNRGLDEEGLNRFFVKVDNKRWQVKKDLRQKIRFSASNLVKDFSVHVPSVDFISCRNVLIYFNDETKADIITRIAKKVNPGGFLILGQVDYINCKEAPEPLTYKIENSFPFFIYEK